MEKYTCECGSVLVNNTSNINAHMITDKHKKFIESKTVIVNIPVISEVPKIVAKSDNKSDSSDKSDNCEEKYKCECGSLIVNNPRNIKIHNATDKHMAYIKSHTEKKAEVNLAPEPVFNETVISKLSISDNTDTNNEVKFICVCGSSITNNPKNIAIHNKTDKHRKAIGKVIN